MFEDLSWVDSDNQCKVIQVLDRKLSTSQRCKEINLNFHKEIILLSLEPIVRFLFNHDNHISGRHPRCLITLSAESNCLTALHTLVNVHFKHLLL